MKKVGPKEGSTPSQNAEKKKGIDQGVLVTSDLTGLAAKEPIGNISLGKAFERAMAKQGLGLSDLHKVTPLAQSSGRVQDSAKRVKSGSRKGMEHARHAAPASHLPDVKKIKGGR